MSNSSTSPKHFKITTLKILRNIKQERDAGVMIIIPIYKNKNLLGYLRPITKSAFNNLEEIKRFAKWRKKSERWFPAQFKVTLEGTNIWIKDRLIDTPDRFLFMIENTCGQPIGHVGLFRFNFDDFSCEVDNVIRGENLSPGIMTPAIESLIEWTKENLGVKKLTLEVFSDNTKAIKLYKRCGFKEFKRIPLMKNKNKDRVEWIEDPSLKKGYKRENVYMVLK